MDFVTHCAHVDGVGYILLATMILASSRSARSTVIFYHMRMLQPMTMTDCARQVHQFYISSIIECDTATKNWVTSPDLLIFSL